MRICVPSSRVVVVVVVVVVVSRFGVPGAVDAVGGGKSPHPIPFVVGTVVVVDMVGSFDRKKIACNGCRPTTRGSFRIGLRFTVRFDSMRDRVVKRIGIGSGTARSFVRSFASTNDGRIRGGDARDDRKS